MRTFNLDSKSYDLNLVQVKDVDSSSSIKSGGSEYIANLRDPKVIDCISSNFEDAALVTDENSFTEEECSWLYSYAFKACRTVRHNANGTIFIAGNFDPIANKFKDKLEKILPNCFSSPVIHGNYFITPDQYGLHNDSTRMQDWEDSFKKIPKDDKRRRYVPWRNIIIPLWISGDPDTISHGVWFEQRHIDFAHVFCNKMEREIATTYPIVRDHSEINFHLNNGNIQDKSLNHKEFDKFTHEKYLHYTPKDRMQGLSTELIAPWIPGCPIVFDAFQLHATNKGTNIDIDINELGPSYDSKKSPRKEWTSKMGLLLCFLKEIEDYP